MSKRVDAKASAILTSAMRGNQTPAARVTESDSSGESRHTRIRERTYG
jgi:hypothetical protein